MSSNWRNNRSLVWVLVVFVAATSSTIHGNKFDTIERFVSENKIDCSKPLECLDTVADNLNDENKQQLGLLMELASVEQCDYYSMNLLREFESDSGGLSGLVQLGQLVRSLISRVASRCDTYLSEQFKQANEAFSKRPLGHLDILKRDDIALFGSNPSLNPEQIELSVEGWAHLVRLLATATSKLRLLEAAGNSATTNELLDELLVKPCKQLFQRLNNLWSDTYLVRMYAKSIEFTRGQVEAAQLNYSQLFGVFPAEVQDALYRIAMCQTASEGFQLDQAAAISSQLAKLGGPPPIETD